MRRFVRALGDIAVESGGKTYVAPPTNKSIGRADAIAIAHRIDNHYFVGFVATDLARNLVRIELRDHKNASLRIESAPAGVTS